MRFFKRPTEHFWRTTLLALLIGAVSGALGAIAAWSSLLAYQGSVFSRESTPLVATRRPGASSDTSFLKTFGEDHARQVAAVFVQHTDSAAPFLPHESLGSGLVLTNDGWIISHRSVVSPARIRELRIGVGPAVLPVLQIVEDTETGILFLKVPGTNLAPAVFPEERTLLDGDQVFLVLASGEVHETRVQDRALRGDAFASPDKPETVVAFRDALPVATKGAPVFASDGTVMGIALAAGDEAVAAIPAHTFVPLIRSVLAGEALLRPMLGVRGIPLTHGWNAEGGRSRGFLIQGDRSGVPAILSGSPAAAAGLRSGDIIIKVNDVVLNGGKDLSEFLLAEKPQDVIDLTIVRDALELVVPVTLGSRVVSRSY